MNKKIIKEIPLFKPNEYIKQIGTEVLNSIERPLIGIHLRRGDRISKNLTLQKAMEPNNIYQKISEFKYNTVFYCTNDSNYNLNYNNFINFKHFESLKNIKNNYILYCIEMFIIDNSDISIRTFNDSTIYYYKKDPGMNFTLTNYNMCTKIKIANRIKIPHKFIEQKYNINELN